MAPGGPGPGVRRSTAGSLIRAIITLVKRSGPTQRKTPLSRTARADRLIDSVRAAAATRALLFSHAHFLRVLAARWIGLPAESGVRLLLGTGAVSVLGWERETRAIVRWNVPASRSSGPAAAP